MILNCPSCSAKFMISSEALGADGREVRCGKCGHMWFQPGERDSLDELTDVPIEEDFESAIERVNSQLDEMDLGFTPHVESFPKSFEAKQESPVITRKAGKKKHILSAIAAIIIVAILGAAFINFRDSLVRKYPSLTKTYGVLGLAASSAQPQLSFDRLKIIKSGSGVSGSGYVINLAATPVRMKSLSVDLLSATRDVLASQKVELKEKDLKGESSIQIDFEFKNAPAAAQSVRVYTAD